MEQKSERLCYRSLTVADTESLFAIYRRKEVVRWLHMPLPVDRERVRAKILARCSEMRHTGVRCFVIVEKRSRQVIGMIDLHHQSSPHTMELGYVLHPHWQHHGYMREALGWLLAYGFVELGLHRINAWCARENAASIAVLEYFRFHREGCLPLPQRLGDGRPHVMNLYSLMREEWRKPYDKTAGSQI